LFLRELLFFYHQLRLSWEYTDHTEKSRLH
jgi:hypothetical protein